MRKKRSGNYERLMRQKVVTIFCVYPAKSVLERASNFSKIPDFSILWAKAPQKTPITAIGS